MSSSTALQPSLPPTAAPHASVLLRTERVRKAFGGQVVLNGIDLELHRGEVVLLRGENGSGKTTLLNILTGFLSPDSGIVHYTADETPRSYRFPRPWWHSLNPFTHFTPEFVAREGIVRTWQDVRLFGAQTLRDNIEVAAPAHAGENPLAALVPFSRIRNDEAGRSRHSTLMLERVGLSGRESSSADRISLGQSKRVAIARAIAAGARILFLDEPLAGLDRQGIRDVMSLLETLVREQQVTLVVVEHVFNHPHLRDVVTSEWLLAGGRLHPVASNDGTRPPVFSAGALLHRPAAVATPPLTPSPALDGAARAFWSELAGNSADMTTEILPRGALLTRIRRAPESPALPPPALEISHLVVSRGARVAVGLDDGGTPVGLSMTLRKGDIAVLQAPNGWGKSSLLAALTAVIPSKGRICLHGRDITAMRTWDRARAGLAVLRSDNNTFLTLRASDVVKLACRGRRLSNAADRFSDRSVGSLSGGERQRVALQAIPESTVYVFDEPLAALDSPEPFFNLINQLAEQTILILLPSTMEPGSR
jgi:branched-chain amino acid transport system ATP-binding protein